MKAIMHRMVFDTETATAIAEYDNRLSKADFRWCEETLYKTPKGQWFLHGRGGPQSPWSHRLADGTRGSGERLEHLMDDHDAIDWCERRGIHPDEVSEHLALDDA